MKLAVLPFFLFFISISIFGQKSQYAISTIPDSLKQNANAIIRLSEFNIDITSQKAMTIRTKVVTTVLNELGLRNLDLSENYDKNRKVTQIVATTYDALGKEVKTYKRKDFKDTSVADGISVFIAEAACIAWI